MHVFGNLRRVSFTLSSDINREIHTRLSCFRGRGIVSETYRLSGLQFLVKTVHKKKRKAVGFVQKSSQALFQSILSRRKGRLPNAFSEY